MRTDGVHFGKERMVSVVTFSGKGLSEFAVAVKLVVNVIGERRSDLRRRLSDIELLHMGIWFSD